MIDASADQAITTFARSQEAAAVLTRYALACDQRDPAALVDLFHPRATADYDGAPQLTGGPSIAEWILQATAHLRWQQHSIRIMSAQLRPDEERVDVIGYLTSHQVAHDTPTSALMMNSRYDVVVTLLDGRWVIERLTLVVGTIENRPVQLGALVAVAEDEGGHA